MTAPRLSVLIPTHNPRADSLARVFAALAVQTLPASDWELIVIDNASTPPVQLPPDWQGRARVVVETTLGLTHARMCGLAQARAPLLVWVDDDNVLAPDYLAEVLAAFAAEPQLGALGGKSLPEYAITPPAWFHEGIAPLGCRDLGDQPQVMAWSGDYPAAAPIGAGLAIRRELMASWVDAVRRDPRRQALGRQGTRLTSGEDNDICLTVLRAGFLLGYQPRLQLVHLIAAGRLQADYLARIARVSFRDFIRVLALHGIQRWTAIPPWTVPLRGWRAFFAQRAWRGPVERIRWQAALGSFEGRAALTRENER